ncbi:MAG TPA: hypothetical protein VF331_02305 [Polyangiales bacterium]
MMRFFATGSACRLLLACGLAIAAAGCKSQASTAELTQPDSGSPYKYSSDQAAADSGPRSLPDGGAGLCPDGPAAGLLVELLPQAGWECSKLHATLTDRAGTTALQITQSKPGLCRLASAFGQAGSFDITVDGYGRFLTLTLASSGPCQVGVAHRVLRFTQACTSAPGDAGAADGGMDDGDAGALAMVCVQTPCVDGTNTYAVGDLIQRGGSNTCVCLEGGLIGRCTGVLPPDAGH